VIAGERGRHKTNEKERKGHPVAMEQEEDEDEKLFFRDRPINLEERGKDGGPSIKKEGNGFDTPRGGKEGKPCTGMAISETKEKRPLRFVEERRGG